MTLYSYRIGDYFTPGTIPYTYGYEFLVASLAAIFLFRSKGRYRFWLVGAVAILLLALGPYLQPWRIPLPFAAFSLWPPLGQFRTPARLAMPALLGLSIVAGFALAHLLRREGIRPIALAVVVLALGARLVFAIEHDPVILQAYPDYATYHQIAGEPGDFSLLEVPFGVRSGFDRVGSGGEILQYYQHVHGKRLLNGMIARVPEKVFQFYRTHPSLLLLAGAAPQVDGGELDRDFAEVIDWSGAGYVLVHRSLLDPARAADIEAFLDRQPQLVRLGFEKDMVIYALTLRVD